ncbi:hypothetical protein MYSTI_06890 [Myxococcus stipitatus DSM 14675]|uniref:Phage tail sheath protein n=1 Tax=Myxococcus stipitatus (strain DSM 14675 / JCM 12634 / Mx s8) TaxID=1278073 RepID=L7UJI1_MYXSD|nr:phage tail sheath C-terminal domain-containing protein [Myxococcus stipitatus]AGC48163.1 hypothetical protein MYSTI_06890 [Myxococcus stipitatus DSM 14675]
MPANLAAPGVYIEELPSGVRTITGVSTSVTAFIGRARRGPVNHATPISSWADFERGFGGLWNQGELGHTVSQFFQNGGREAVIVRVDNGSATAGASVPGGMVLAVSPQIAARAGFHHLRVTVAHGGAPGAYDLTLQAEDVANVVLKDDTNPDKLPFSRTVSLTVGSDPTAAIAAPAATSPAIPLASLVGPGPSARPTAGATLSNGVEVRLPVAATLNLVAANEGSWANGIVVTLLRDAGSTTFGLQAQRFDATGRELENEVYYNLVLTPGAPTYVGDVLASRSSLIRLDGNPGALPLTTATATLAGGTDGNPPTIAQYTGSEANRTGLHALEELDVVNLLCVPFPSSVTVVSEADRTGFWSGTALPWCRTRGAFAIIDPPPSWSNFDAVNTSLSNGAGWMSQLRSPHGAQYFPTVLAPDPLQQNRLRAFPPCGVVAGVIARTDSTRGVWKAPAGLDATLAGVLDLSVPLTDGEQGVLNREGVNCLRGFPGMGRVAWGARTLLGQDKSASEWKYVPVRRLASYLEQSLLRGSRWAVFEGNDEPLWSQLRLNVGAFLHQLFRQGAFAGRTPTDSYFVRCDKNTTTQADIDAGIVNVLIGFAPVKPAEFVVLKIQQLAGQGV